MVYVPSFSENIELCASIEYELLLGLKFSSSQSFATHIVATKSTSFRAAILQGGTL